jgi:hypothetical protein
MAVRVNDVSERVEVRDDGYGSHVVVVVDERVILTGSSKAMADTVAERYERARSEGKTPARSRRLATFKELF